MCGIVGIFKWHKNAQNNETHLRQMLAMIRHRGPDEAGIYVDATVGLGSARLSIIDLSTGQQPLTNEDETCWIVFNGEIFNYLELRDQLEQRGHRFRTQSDTEVIVHLYEEYGTDCVSYLNGQFALAIWDARQQRLFCARDRVGIRPLFYAQHDGTLLFGSEIKALIAHPLIQPEIDVAGLDQIFTYWTTRSPNTAFKDIFEVPPGHYLVAQGDKLTIEPYWGLTFEGATQPLSDGNWRKYAEELQTLLIDATRIRLRADVPVGAYLSGGLDSSIITSIINNFTDNRLETFSITFDDASFDESVYQTQMINQLETHHQTAHITHTTIGEIFPEIIWHTETPILRTAPAPMYLLSKLVHDHQYKVVMTGEGADEFFGGYNIFKETMLRRFWARQPESELRPMLLDKIYPYVGDESRQTAFFRAFFRQHLEETHLNEYSHILRWNNTARLKRFFGDDVKDSLTQQQPTPMSYPDTYENWHPLEKAQYLESTVFMSGYLLSSQGDRMGMANSVEGRYPFLDHRVVEFANRLPPNLKLRTLTEKFLLKQIGKQWLPDIIWQRSKHPYRAPIKQSFFHADAPDYVADLLSTAQIEATGLFNPKAVGQFMKKIERGMALGETDNMAIAGILSTQLLHQRFIANFMMPAPTSDDEMTNIIRR